MSPSLESQKRALLAELTAARLDLLQAVCALPAARRDDALIGTWSVKDLLAHLAGWDAANLQAVQDMLAGQYPSFFQYYDADWRTYNARLVRENKIEPFEALLAAVERSHSLLLGCVQALPAGSLFQTRVARPGGRPITPRTLLAAEARDERVHAGQVRALLST